MARRQFHLIILRLALLAVLYIGSSGCILAEDSTAQWVTLLSVDFADEPLGPLTEIEGVRHFPYWVPEVVNAPARSGKSLKLIPNEPGRYGSAVCYMFPEEITSGKVKITVWLYPESNIHRSVIVGAGGNQKTLGDRDAVSLYLHNNGTIQAYAGGWQRLDGTYKAQEWVSLIVIVDLESKTYDVYVQDMTTKVGTVSFRDPTVEVLQYVGVGIYSSGGQPGPVYVDSLVVEKML